MDAALQPLCRPQGGAGGEARDRGLRVHPRRDRRAARRSRRTDRRDPERGRPAVLAGRPRGGGRLRARRRDARAAQEPVRRPAGCPVARLSPAESWARVAGAVFRSTGGWVGSPTTSSPRSTAARAASSTRRCTRASASRCWRRWPAARRSSRARAEPPRRSRAAAAVLVDPRDPASIAAGIEEAAARRDELRAARSGAGGAVHLGADGDGDPGRVRAGGRMTPKPLVVIDADVLGRQRTGDETYVENLLRRLPELGGDDFRFAAITRHPELVPDGVEPIRVATGSQELRMAWSVPRLLRRLRPALAHFQHALPFRCPCPTVVTIHDLSFERDPRAMGRRDRFVFKRVVPRAARRGAARDRCERADEARPGRPLRRPARPDRRDAARCRSRLRPGPSARAATTCCTSARCRRGRIRSLPRAPRGTSGCPSWSSDRSGSRSWRAS